MIAFEYIKFNYISSELLWKNKTYLLLNELAFTNKTGTTLVYGGPNIILNNEYCMSNKVTLFLKEYKVILN